MLDGPDWQDGTRGGGPGPGRHVPRAVGAGEGTHGKRLQAHILTSCRNTSTVLLPLGQDSLRHEWYVSILTVFFFLNDSKITFLKEKIGICETFC